MTTLKFQKRLAKLMKSGEVQEVHHELARLPLKEELGFDLLHIWVEILSCTGMAPVAVALRGQHATRLNAGQRSIVSSYLAVAYWQEQDWKSLEALVVASLGKARHEVGGKDMVNAQSHTKLCVRLFAYHLQHLANYGRSDLTAKLITIGDSHCLVPAGRTLHWCGRDVCVQAMPIRGVKMYHLGHGSPPKYRAYLKERLRQLPADADVLLSMGEIDCRPNEGIFHAAHKAGGSGLEELLEGTIREFVAYVAAEMEASGARPRSVTWMGMPWPVYDIAARLPAGSTQADFYGFIDKVNEAMQRAAHRVGWHFLDVKSATRNAGESTSELWLDDIHLSPAFYDQAEQWRRDERAGRVEGEGDQASLAYVRPAETSPSFLHVDCGSRSKAQTTAAFNHASWREVRLDRDPANRPDIIGSVAEMSAVSSGSVGAVFSKNDINRLYPHQVSAVLQEFLRVLTPAGYLVICCPDLKSISALVAQDRLTEPVCADEGGALAPLDLIYGSRARLARGDSWAAFRCGFTAKILAGTLKASGFQSIAGKVRDKAPFFDICLIASKQSMADSDIRKLVDEHFPDNIVEPDLNAANRKE